MEQQSCYLPEGSFLETPQNAAAIGSEAGLREAIATGRRLEARVRVCDGAHNLHVELPCMRGLIPRAEGALGISDKIPEYDIMPRIPDLCSLRIKSGVAPGVRNFVGYFTNENEQVFSFSILCNNYNCDEATIDQLIKGIIEEIIRL